LILECCLLERGDGHRRPERRGPDLDVEGVVPEEDLGDEQARDEHDEVLAGALLVVQRGRGRLGPVGPDDVAEQPVAVFPEEPVGHVLVGAREDARVPGGHGLVAEEHLPLAHLVPVVVALDHHVPLRAAVLHRHGRLDPQRLVDGRLDQRHLGQRAHGDAARAVAAHGVAHLGRQHAVRLRPGAAQPLDQRREQDLHPAEGVEAHGEYDVVDGLLPGHAEPLALVDDRFRRVAEEGGEAVVVLLHERGWQAEGVEQRVLNEPGQAEAEQRAELEQHPLEHEPGPVALQRGVGRVAAEERAAEERERRCVVEAPEVGLPGPGQLVLHTIEQVAVHLAERGDHVLPPVGEEVEQQLLERRVGRLGRVDVRQHAVPAGELGRWHERAREQVRFVDEVGVEEHGERGGVEECHHARVLGHEGPGGHVEADDGGAVRAHAGREEAVAAARAVEELGAVAERAHQRRAVVAWDLAQREPPLRGHHLLLPVLVRRGGRPRDRPGCERRLPRSRRREGGGGDVGRRCHPLLTGVWSGGGICCFNCCLCAGGELGSAGLIRSN
jgi:hypothetical protein